MGCGPSATSKSDLRGPQGKKRSSCVMTIKSAVLIQNWYRRYRARLEARRRCTWTIFQTIEYAGEQDQLKLYNFFNDMLLHMDSRKENGKTIATVISNRNSVQRFDSLDDEEFELFKQTDPANVKMEHSYKGPHLCFPLDMAQIDKLVDAFRHRKKLHAKYVLELLHEARKVLKQKGNVNHASTAISKQITVCGDLHGKVDDVFMIFYKNGMPSTQNPYVFNGDFVDRGGFSVETAMVLFSCFLVNPNCLYLNRGNHEDHVLNLRYGFNKEIMQKYKEHAPKLIRLFEDVFSWLPLATVIDNKILVAHGGISDKTDLAVLEKLERHRYISVLRPPIEDEVSSNANHEEIAARRKEILMEWRQILDILWSDPKPRTGCRPNTFRGGGSYFGPDISRLVLSKHGLKMLIRSHECKLEGYEYTHNGLVLTIFSASNYYEEGSNKGAYVKLDSNLEAHIVQYMVPRHKYTRKLTITQRVSRVEESAIRNLRERICSTRGELGAEFKKYDTKDNGLISLSEWCKAMEDILSFNLPWRTLRPQLVKMDNNNMVLYSSTFEQFQIRNKFNEGGQTVTEALYRNKDSLEVIFRAIDTDGSGRISMDEFREACALLSEHTGVPIPQDSIVDLARCIDINKDGFIDFNEFLEAFRMVDSGMNNCMDMNDDGTESPDAVT